MPGDAVRQIVGRSDPSLTVIQSIALSRDVLLSAAAWRYGQTTDQHCALVWSGPKRSSWCKRSQGFRFAVSLAGAIRQGTFANDCFARREVPGLPQPISASLWLDSLNVSTHALIWEQSKALPNYLSVLTLLWIRERIEISSGSDSSTALDEL
jgi:hypothetical protein